MNEFYYAVLTDDDDHSFTAGEITRIKFLQNIEVEMPQEAMRTYGDNGTAEIAISGGEYQLNFTKYRFRIRIFYLV
ncbi:hypothetical protein CN689_06315 [Peribacillus butanolivorans]|uniref:Uncharacterized protein n=1 Tax=Peribacillus butanolivorans TaxID=421767 RepID=A0AAX0S6H3_9BACI|nr:major tail protein [Peribacillus butanolivorans]PEJ34937.1 hypothetical protein CN689_06315 [Peribacillus butanolivorans]